MTRANPSEGKVEDFNTRGGNDLEILKTLTELRRKS